MIPLTILPDIKEPFPDIHVGVLCGNVINTDYDEELWKEISESSRKLHSEHSLESIREIPAIKMAKSAYRKLGKDPNRYRISAEALLRRIAKGNQLYQINTLVDLLNLVSIQTGITIGGFDREKVVGNVNLGIGRENEDFEAIGRGELNIHRLPVYRDSLGAIGSPTSDSIRTRMLPETTEILMIITGFYGADGIEDCINRLVSLIEKYISGKNFDIRITE